MKILKPLDISYDFRTFSVFYITASNISEIKQTINLDCFFNTDKGRQDRRGTLNFLKLYSFKIVLLLSFASWLLRFFTPRAPLLFQLLPIVPI